VLDLQEAGIRLNVVSPGPVRSPFLLDFAGDDPAQQQGMPDYLRTQIPHGRVSEPEAIAKVALSWLPTFPASSTAPRSSPTVIRHGSEQQWRRECCPAAIQGFC
jgi:NAD(P)-dependent dehydrogenase (short-subunit alcohol dehydrogenase family)